MLDRTSAQPARATTLAVVVTCGVTPYLRRTLTAVAGQTHPPEIVLVVDVAAPGRDIGTGEPVIEVVQRCGLEDVTRVRLVTAPEADTFGDAVRLGLEAYARLVERAARRAGRTDPRSGSVTANSSFRATGEISPVTTGEMRAVSDGVLDVSAVAGPDWLWLLHDDSAPAPEALDRQLRAAEGGRSLAVVGAKQVDWDEPDRLLQVGVQATRTARRVPDVEPKEIDQGQHDHRQDVLAVGTAGMLIGTEVWDRLGGTDPVLGPFGDGLELCRRVRAAGYRVVVEPRAHVRHRRASYLGLRDSGAGGVRVVDAHAVDGPAADLPVDADAASPLLAPGAPEPDAPAPGGPAADAPAADAPAPGEAGAAETASGGPRPGGTAVPRLPARDSAGPTAGRSYSARRTAQIYNALVAARPGTWPLLLTGYVLIGPLRALWRLLGKDAPLAAAEIGGVTRVLGRLGAVRAARRRTAAVARGPRTALRELEATGSDVRSARSAIRRQAATARRLAEAPSELELAERAELGRRRRLALGVVLLVAATLALPFVLPMVGGGQPVGGALAHLGRSAEELWAAARSTWVASGVGAPGPADPLLTVLGAAAWVLDLVGLSPGAVATLAVLLAVPAAAATAWAAAGAATRNILVRSAVSLTWAASPVLWLGLGQGRIGAVLAHVTLPLVALGVTWVAGVQRRDVILSGLTDAHRVAPGGVSPDDDAARARTSSSRAPRVGTRPAPARTSRSGAITGAAGAGLALALAAAGAPILLPATVVVLVLLAPFVPRRHLLLLVPVPALALLAPLLLAARHDPALAVADPGPGLASDPGPAWLALLGHPQALAATPRNLSDVGDLPWQDLLTLLPGAAVLVLAVVALLRTARTGAVRAGWLVAAAGIATVVLATRTPGGVGETVDGLPVLVHGWAGPGVSLALLGLLLAVAAGADGIPEALRSRDAGWRQLLAGVGAVVVVAVPLTAAGTHVLTDGDELVRPRDGGVVPALSVEQQLSPQRSRVLHLRAGADEVVAELWRGDGRRQADAPAALRLADETEAEDDLARAVALLGAGGNPEAVEQLSRHAVGVVILAADPAPGGSTTDRETLAAALASVPGLERVTDDESGTVLRLSRDPSVEGSADSVARVRLVPTLGGDRTDGPPVDVPAEAYDVGTGIDVSDRDRLLLLAESVDDGWRAEVDGVELAAVEHGWQQAFVVPAGVEGGLTVEHRAPWSGRLGVVQAVVLGVVALLALPLRARREEDW